MTKQEPFGYFRAEPFGWTDCAETDEGAVALYERPQPVCDMGAMCLQCPDATHKESLSDEQITKLVDSITVYTGEYSHAIARAIEAAHNIK